MSNVAKALKNMNRALLKQLLALVIITGVSIEKKSEKGCRAFHVWIATAKTFCGRGSDHLGTLR
jgi:hypothetical protein